MTPTSNEDHLLAELQEFQAIQVESMGWLPLEEGAYLHVGNPNTAVIKVVGMPQLDMAGSSVLWLV